jgi:hypothetical protein
MTRKGFFAALKLDNPYSEKGFIKLHEKTLAKSKTDKLKLLVDQNKYQFRFRFI